MSDTPTLSDPSPAKPTAPSTPAPSGSKPTGDLSPSKAPSSEATKKRKPKDDDSDMSADRSKTRIVKLVAKTAAGIASAPADVRGVLAAVLGTDDDLEKLTAAAYLASKRDLAPAENVATFADMDALEAGINISQLDRRQFKALWSIVAQLGPLDEKAPTSVTPASAMELTKAIQGLGPEKLKLISAAAKLVG